MKNINDLNLSTNEYYISYRELLNRQVSNNPNRIFIKTHNDNYTWKDIEKASQIIAKDLQEIGISNNSRVGLYCSNGINWIVTFFAICKIQATPFLLNNALSARELVVTSEVGNIEFLCCEEISNKDYNLFIKKIKTYDNNKIKKFYKITNTNIKDRFSEHIEKINVAIDNEEANVVLFSSGSTGVPKAVVQSQNMMVYCAKQHADNLKMNENDKHCLVLPLFHIFGLYTVLLPTAICNGQVIIPEEIKTSSIIEVVEKEKCTALNTVPTLLIAILANKNYKPERFNSLRYSIIGGATALPKQIEMFIKLMPATHIMNSYGLTENYHISITDYNCSIESIKKSVGKLYKDVEVMIKDNNTNKECERNETGEVLIRGFNMIGYYNSSNENKHTDLDGWFHTGDLGYIDENGSICLNGRIKEVIIRSGETIMPLEIETALTNLKEVNEAKVFGIPDEFRGEEIVACLTINNEYEYNEQKMRDDLLETIAKYKIPKYFYVFEYFPKLATGKIDIKRIKSLLDSKLM